MEQHPQPTQELFEVTSKTKAAHKRFLKEERDLRGLDNLASMVSGSRTLAA